LALQRVVKKGFKMLGFVFIVVLGALSFAAVNFYAVKNGGIPEPMR
jgi:hypothetical protein